jgi:DNA-directed RNA polymerase alpha subunit
MKKEGIGGEWMAELEEAARDAEQSIRHLVALVRLRITQAQSMAAHAEMRGSMPPLTALTDGQRMVMNKNARDWVCDGILSMRAYNAIRALDIEYVGDLAGIHESALLKVPNCGKKTVREIRECLSVSGLKLGMVSDWTRPNGSKQPGTDPGTS